MAGANSGSVGRGKAFPQEAVNHGMACEPLLGVSGISRQPSSQGSKDRAYPTSIHAEPKIS